MRRCVAVVLVGVGLHGCHRPRLHVSASPPGETVEVSRLLVPGKTTVLQFYADWCATCAEFKKVADAALPRRPSLAVAYVDIVSFDSPAARQFEIHSIPYFRVYGPDGALRSEGAAAYQWFWNALHTADSQGP